MQIILFENSTKHKSRRRSRVRLLVVKDVVVDQRLLLWIIIVIMMIAIGERTTISIRRAYVHCLTTGITKGRHHNVINNNNHFVKNRHQQRKQSDYRPLFTSSVSPPELSTVEIGNDDDDYNREIFVPEKSSGTSLTSSTNMLLRDLNPSQIEAVTQPLRIQEHDSSSSSSSSSMIVTRVIAGPGSGKTKVLTTRIAFLLQQDPYGKVLAVTFTRKAAGEMKERLEKLLREQQRIIEENNTIDDNTNNNSYNNDDDVHEDETIRMDRFGQIIEQEFAHTVGEVDVEGSTNPKGIERVELGTFHSICAKILRYNGDSLRDLPSVQRDMSQATPVFIERQEGSDLESSSSSSSSNGLVQPEINLNGQYIIADQSEQIRILKECLKEREIDLKTSDVKPIQILSTIGRMKEQFAQGQDPFFDTRKKGSGGGAGATLRMARKIYYLYREKLLTNNAVDFDDLILMTRELLMEDVELRERLHKRWPHVLVDEYQDTSKVQMDLIKLLTSSSLLVVGDADQSIYSWRGAHVGSLEDVKTEFESYGKVQTVFLKENYRSTSNIVRAAEKVISSNQGRKPVSLLKKENDGNNSEDANDNNKEDTNDDLRRSMKPKRGTGPSPRVIACEDERAEATFVVDTILNMTTQGDVAPGETVAVLYRTNAQSRYLEEACVQKNLPYVIRGGAGGFYKRAEIRDCLCFLRWLSNGNDEGSMIRAMKTPSKGIGAKAYEEFKNYCEIVQTYVRQYYPLNERPTPLDILISMSNNEEVEVGDRNHNYVLPNGAPEAIDSISKRALNNLLKFSSKMQGIRSLAHTETVDKLLFFIIEDLNIMDHIDTISKSKSEFAERTENVQELRQATKKYVTYGPSLNNNNDAATSTSMDDPFDNESALSKFLDDVALVSDIAEANSEDKENPQLIVDLMTIHGSKGTEYDCVFVVGVEEGTLPCNPALQEGEGSIQLEEEKRLCYVAMTRAKTRLILTWRKEVTGFSNWSDSGPKTVKKQRSRFLNAIVSRKSKQNKIVGGKGITSKRASTSSRSRNSRLGTPSSRLEHSTSTRTLSSSNRNTSSNRANVDRLQQLRSSLTSSSNTTPSPKQRKRNKNPRSSSTSSSFSQQHVVDPMWFFPVGQSVVHINIGKGIVLDHPPFDKIEDAKVRVKFENGKTSEFPAIGSDVIPLN